tara:strand:+ start:245 stop:481 length:237 start_codon:yes stop_codon:yes gene_type:complete
MAGLDFYQALKLYYESQKQESLAVLKLCITSPVAIGDHMNILDDMKDHTRKLAEAEESLEVLNKYFQIQQPDPGVINE